MDNRLRPTRSGLFAIELLISVGIFIFCAAICLGLFSKAESISSESADLNRAVNEARSVSECYKACGGDIDSVSKLLDSKADSESIMLFYDDLWNRVSEKSISSFNLILSQKENGAVVTVCSSNKELLSWFVSALEVAG